MNTPSQPNRESIREEMDKLRYPDRSIVNAPVDSTPSMMLSDWVWKKIDQALAEQREADEARHGERLEAVAKEIESIPDISVDGASVIEKSAAIVRAAKGEISK